MKVALVHDYLTERAGGDRVVLAMHRAFPAAPIYTAVYNPLGTYSEFRDADVRPLFVDRMPHLRSNHRLALPLLAPAFSRLRVKADVVLCSSAGWAHGAHVEGRKVVYCYTPARWLYQAQRYLGRGRRPLARSGLALLTPPLRRWDRRAAASADRYLAISTAVCARIKSAYDIDAEVLPAPSNLDVGGPQEPLSGVAAGYFLCVSRFLPYKNVDAIIDAFAGMPDQRLIVVGSGPQEQSLRARAAPNVQFTGRVSDNRLRWLYAHSAGVVAASYEDFGLTPIEGAGFGRPAAVLRWGGFLDTLDEGRTGVYFNQPRPDAIQAAIRRLLTGCFDAEVIRTHAERFSELRFIERLRAIVAEEAALRAR